MKDRFQKGSGTYICRDCGKQTRETGYGESDSGLCACCFRIAEWENALSDGSISEEEFDRIVEEIKKEYTGKKLKNFNRKTYNKKEDVMNTEQLRKAASDLNKTLGLEPKIDTRLQKEELTEKVSKAGTLLEDGDKIEQNTFDVLAELEVDIPAGVKKVKAQGAEKDSGKEKTEKAPAKEKKEKAEESEKMNEYGFRIGSASGDTSEAIMAGKSEEVVIKMIMDKHGKDERVATGRFNIITRELKKRGFLK